MDISRRGALKLAGIGGITAISGCSNVVAPGVRSWSRGATLTPRGGTDRVGFAESIGSSGDGSTVAVGARRSEPRKNDDPTAAFVFERADGSWSLRTLPAPDDGDPAGSYCVDVSRDGSTVLVGTHGVETMSDRVRGTAYVFERHDGSWSRTAEVRPENVNRSERFGASVALAADGRTAAIGAPLEYPGSAYVYERSNGEWRESAELTAEDSHRFGHATAVSSDGATIIVGAPYTTTTSEGITGSATVAGKSGRPEIFEPFCDVGCDRHPGAAYVFERSDETWSRTARFVPQPGRSNNLGAAVALTDDGSLALVGAPGERVMIHRGGSETLFWGSVYVFERSGGSWTPRPKLVAGDSVPYRDFGRSIAVSAAGSSAIVGITTPEGSTDTSPDSASVFAHSEGVWARQTTLSPAAKSGQPLDHTVALAGDGETAVLNRHGKNHRGSIAVFE